MKTTNLNATVMDLTIEQINEVLNGTSKNALVDVYRKKDSDGNYYDLSPVLNGKVYLETKSKVYIVNHLTVGNDTPEEIWAKFKALYIFAALLQKALMDLREDGVRLNVIPRKAIVKMCYGGTVVFSTARYADFKELPLTLSKSKIMECKNRKDLKQQGFIFARGLFKMLPMTAQIQAQLIEPETEKAKESK